MASQDPNASFWSTNAPPTANTGVNGGTPTPPITTGATTPATGGDQFAQQVTAWYQQYLGRVPTQQEIDSHRGNPGGLPAVQQVIQGAAGHNGEGTGTGATGGTPTLSAQDFIKQWQQSNPASGGIGPLTAALKTAGYTNVSPFMYGNTPSGNELSIDGAKYKVVSGENSANPSWYTAGTNDSGGGSTGTGGNQFGDYTNFGVPSAPYTSNANAPVYTAPQTPASLSTPYTAPTYTAPQFTQPSVAEVQARPGYQIGLDTGLSQINRSAAAKGTILNPGTVQALNQYGTDYAGTQYGNVLNQDMSIFGMNANNAAGAFQMNTGNALNARQQTQSEFQQNVVQPNQQTFTNQYGAWMNDNARTLNDYLQNYNIGHTASTDWWTQANNQANRGVTSASNLPTG